MATSTSPLGDAKIGQVFTPLSWAQWLIERWGVFEAWVDGARVCDPTAGQGAFVLALLHLARQNQVALTRDLLSRITLIELSRSNLDVFESSVRKEFAIDFPATGLIARDVVRETPADRYDILVGNPPWSNFSDLPSAYKELLKSHFVAEGLVPNRKDVLLGCSRTDIAALVLKVALGKLLKENGFGCFYLPTSLFCGDDAHVGFRDYRANGRDFAISEVFEFSSTKIFEVSTSYCCARLDIDCPQTFPVKYHKESGGGWEEYSAIPLHKPSDSWRVVQDKAELATSGVVDIGLPIGQQPRQGVNTCGANAAFIFDHKPAKLPSKYLFPLATKHLWRKGDSEPGRWILLPYDVNTGKALSWSQIEQEESLRDYLLDVKETLRARKGTLIGSAIAKGTWWSQLGVGPYSFAPYKVMWEAYGGTRFEPIVLKSHDGQVWQGNQAMHAFIPCWSESDAQRRAKELLQPRILDLLQQLNGSGKCNWAQPGKIKKILGIGQHYQLALDM